MSVVLIGMFWTGVTFASICSAKTAPVEEISSPESPCINYCTTSTEAIAKEYDFSYLKVGQFTEFNGYDSQGNEFIYRVTRVQKGIDVAVKSETLNNVDTNTVVVFRGPNGVVTSVRLGDVATQRCGWLCLLAHICCVKIHIGPPGNTWEWDCDCVNSNED